jgi:hypothetical protein
MITGRYKELRSITKHEVAEGSKAEKAKKDQRLYPCLRHYARIAAELLRILSSFELLQTAFQTVMQKHYHERS